MENEEKKPELDPSLFSNWVYDTLLNIKTTLSLPTHKTLNQSMKLSAGILVASCVSYIAGFPTAIDPLGALCCFIILLMLSIMEGSEDNELSRMYSAAKLSAGKVVRRAKEAGSSIKARRNTDDSDRSE